MLLRAAESGELADLFADVLADETDDEEAEMLRTVNERLVPVNRALRKEFQPLLQALKRQTSASRTALERLQNEYPEEKFAALFEELLNKIETSLPTPYLQRVCLPLPSCL